MIYHDRCQFCHSLVEYDDQEKEFFCPACGNLLLVIHFKREQDKLKRAEREAAELRAKNVLAEKARQAAENLLVKTLSELETLSSSQENEEELISRIFDGQSFVSLQLDGIEENQQAIRDLIHGLLSGQDAISGRQDALGELMTELMRGQNDATDKLNILNDFAQKICDLQHQSRLEAQSSLNSLRTDLKASFEKSHLDASRQEQLLQSFSKWAKDTRADDLKRLEGIISSTDAISASTKTISESVSALSSSMKNLDTQFRDFQKRLEQKNQDRMLRLHREAQVNYTSRRFDKASRIYETLSIEDSETSALDLAWYRLLCHLGITYDRQTPVMYRPDLSPLQQIPEYARLRQILESVPQEKRITPRLHVIAQQLRDMRFAEQSCKYDVFLCSAPASASKTGALKAQLESMGLKVFCSPDTHLLPESSREEGSILAALENARVMILVAMTAYELIEPSVRSEWVRYQWMIQELNRTDKRLFCCVPEKERSVLLEDEFQELNSKYYTCIPYRCNDNDLHERLDPLFPQLSIKMPAGLTPEIWSQIIAQLNRTQTVQVQTSTTREEPDYEALLTEADRELHQIEKEKLPVRQTEVTSFPYTLDQYDSHLHRIDAIRNTLKTLKGHADIADLDVHAKELRLETGRAKMMVRKGRDELERITKEYIHDQIRSEIPVEPIYIRRRLETLQIRKRDLNRLGIAETDPAYVTCEEQISKLESALRTAETKKRR